MPFSSAAPPTRISSTTPLASSTSPTLPLLLTRPLHTEHRWQPRKNNMSVSLHSLADAALADASERPSGHSRSQPSSQPRPSQAPAEQPVQAAPIQVPVEQAQVSFEYNVRRYKRGERPSQPPAQTTRRHTAPVVPTTATCRTDVSCNDTAQNRGPSSAKGKEYHPLQGVQLDKHHPELSIHGWHEDARRLLQPPRAFSPSYPQRGPSENAVQSILALVGPSRFLSSPTRTSRTTHINKCLTMSPSLPSRNHATVRGRTGSYRKTKSWTRHASPRNSYPIRPVSPAQSTLSNASTILPIDGEPGLDMSSATSSSGSEPFDGTDMDHEESDSDDDSDARDMGGKRKRALQKMATDLESANATIKDLEQRLEDSQGLVNKLQSELHVSQKTAEGCA
ncbi:hypothetical protein C370_07320 [Cryptococcus neoformans A1-35-8]|nr:hypothetical protein C370_07320 [Cryptococcus neoformans var. grubii A1-35-8]